MPVLLEGEVHRSIRLPLPILSAMEFRLVSETRLKIQTLSCRNTRIPPVKESKIRSSAEKCPIFYFTYRNCHFYCLLSIHIRFVLLPALLYQLRVNLSKSPRSCPFRQLLPKRYRIFRQLPISLFLSN